METIARAFDLGLKANRKERPASTFFRGSKLGSCLRQQYYDATGEPVTNPFEDRLYRIFEQGHVIADTFERNLRDSGLFEEFMSEVPVEFDKYNFSGNIDHLVRWKNRDTLENGWEVIEMKSMNSNGFKYLKGPKPEHAIQAASYALALEYNGFLRVPFNLESGQEGFCQAGYIFEAFLRQGVSLRSYGEPLAFN